MSSLNNLHLSVNYFYLFTHKLKNWSSQSFLFYDISTSLAFSLLPFLPPFLLSVPTLPLSLPLLWRHPGEHAGNRTEIRSSEGAPLEATDEKTASHVATARPHPWTGTRVIWYHQLKQKQTGGRPDIFYHMNDVDVSSKQRGERSPIEIMSLRPCL